MFEESSEEILHKSNLCILKSLSLVRVEYESAGSEYNY